MSLNQTAKKRQAVNLLTGKSMQNSVNCQKGTGGIEKITKHVETILNSETLFFNAVIQKKKLPL